MQPMFRGRKRALSWTDSNGKFWLYGGYGIDSTARGETLTICGSSTHLWVHMASGRGWAAATPCLDPTIPCSGLRHIGKPGCGQQPGGLEYASGWADKNGNLWLFGGEASDNTNDTQKWYVPDAGEIMGVAAAVGQSASKRADRPTCR